MSTELAIETIQQALINAFWISFPLLAVLFVIGIGVSLLQIVTSIQDPSFSAAPRLAAFVLALFLCLPWILMRLITYTEGLFENLSKYAH